jgi:hypothetical protein
MAMQWSSRASAEDLERARATARMLTQVRVVLDSVDFDALERCLPRAREDLVSSTLGHDVIDTARRFKAALDAALESGV